MTRILSAAAALATSVLLASAAPAFAAPTGYYAATPVTAPTKTKVITAGTLWNCADGVCTAKQSTQRDVIMCQMVVQRVGALSAFTVAGTPLDAAALAKCNERAS
ncbi:MULTISPECIES: hypothetical protein [unclassified Sphingomonas]|uniref:CC_3452 family protein n=1 Tax=unclassified Sphingomonas TaxID=196159 RepID=UPI000BCDBB04|nr:MAG: hypothetical protein B7Z43_05860 [Sphingomonas sp. 12-62-6]OYX38654.1 MAG: hypothetical protein B7Y98_08075 [Sphingomonas sp. 32-62-10]OYY66773.1 MAG: hypothetical protein B7Y49_01790 [Sphingomonas sp. 28-62-11]